MKLPEGICAYIAGGLGNQLFILVAAWQQAKRLGCPLYLDTSHHSHESTWAFALDGLEFPGEVLGSRSPWRSVQVPGGRVLPVPIRLTSMTRKVHFEKDDARYDPRINSITPGTTLFGYFQSARYFHDIHAEVRAMIENSPETTEEADFLAQLEADRRVTVHLRRGDYLLAPEDTRIIASTNYALRARELLTRLGVDYPLRVFSDSPELVREEIGAIDADIEFVAKDAPLSPINTIKAMANGEAFIMSNSSFSWWAAWLMQERLGETARVIAPRPWNETGTARADMLQRTWIGLDAR